MSAATMQKGFADRFADGWIAAWSPHDFVCILAHDDGHFERAAALEPVQ
jgi:hypothetical protein